MELIGIKRILATDKRILIVRLLFVLSILCGRCVSSEYYDGWETDPCINGVRKLSKAAADVAEDKIAGDDYEFSKTGAIGGNNRNANDNNNNNKNNDNDDYDGDGGTEDVGIDSSEESGVSPVDEIRCCNGYQRNYYSPNMCDPICTRDCPEENVCIEPDKCKDKDDFEANLCNVSNCINGCLNEGVCLCFSGHRKVTATECSPFPTPPNDDDFETLGCTKFCQKGSCTTGKVDTCKCFDGYQLSKDDDSVCEPRCNPPCGTNSFCEQPDICECNDGFVIGYRPSNDADHPVCVLPSELCDSSNCVNGTCVQNHCVVCDLGDVYYGDRCIPKCDENCNRHGGSCNRETNSCECHDGYAHDQHDKLKCVPHCEQPCASNQLCVSPNRCDCRDGYVWDNGVCNPYCADSCINGYCILPNTCDCDPDYVLKDGACIPSARRLVLDTISTIIASSSSVGLTDATPTIIDTTETPLTSSTPSYSPIIVETTLTYSTPSSSSSKADNITSSYYTDSISNNSTSSPISYATDIHNRIAAWCTLTLNNSVRVVNRFSIALNPDRYFDGNSSTLFSCFPPMDDTITSDDFDCTIVCTDKSFDSIRDAGFTDCSLIMVNQHVGSINCYVKNLEKSSQRDNRVPGSGSEERIPTACKAALVAKRDDNVVYSFSTYFSYNNDHDKNNNNNNNNVNNIIRSRGSSDDDKLNEQQVDDNCSLCPCNQGKRNVTIHGKIIEVKICPCNETMASAVIDDTERIEKRGVTLSHLLWILLAVIVIIVTRALCVSFCFNRKRHYRLNHAADINNYKMKQSKKIDDELEYIDYEPPTLDVKSTV